MNETAIFWIVCVACLGIAVVCSTLKPWRFALLFLFVILLCLVCKFKGYSDGRNYKSPVEANE